MSMHRVRLAIGSYLALVGSALLDAAAMIANPAQTGLRKDKRAAAERVSEEEQDDASHFVFFEENETAAQMREYAPPPSPPPVEEKPLRGSLRDRQGRLGARK